MAKKEYLLTKGTNIFVVDTTDSGNVVHKICATSAKLDSGKPNKIDVTSLCETEKHRFVDGLAGESESTISCVFQPEDTVHQMLLKAADDGRILQFIIAGGESKDEPTWSGSEWATGDTRSFWAFSAHVTSFPWEFDVDQVVKLDITLTMDSKVRVKPKGASDWS